MNEAASSVEPEVKTRFATVNDAAFETFLHEKDAKMMQVWWTWYLSTELPTNMENVQKTDKTQFSP